MSPVPAELLQYVSEWSPTLLPIAFILTSTISSYRTPSQHSLLITAISWALLWAYSCAQVGVFTGQDNSGRRRLCRYAGGLLALAILCERVASDREGTWLSKVGIPSDRRDGAC